VCASDVRGDKKARAFASIQKAVKNFRFGVDDGMYACVDMLTMGAPSNNSIPGYTYINVQTCVIHILADALYISEKRATTTTKYLQSLFKMMTKTDRGVLRQEVGEFAWFGLSIQWVLL